MISLAFLEQHHLQLQHSTATIKYNQEFTQEYKNDNKTCNLLCD